MISENRVVRQPTNEAGLVGDGSSNVSNVVGNVVENIAPTPISEEENLVEKEPISEEEELVKRETPDVINSCSQCINGQLCFQCGHLNGM